MHAWGAGEVVTDAHKLPTSCFKTKFLKDAQHVLKHCHCSRESEGPNMNFSIGAQIFCPGNGRGVGEKAKSVCFTARVSPKGQIQL
jgi:hypothetical protein